MDLAGAPGEGALADMRCHRQYGPRRRPNIGPVRWGQSVGPGSDILVFDRVVAEVDNHRMEAPLEPDEECMQVALGRQC